MSAPIPALVVGGGISGLVCAYALRKAGIDAQVLEASERAGGVIRSVRRDGYLLELGPQSFAGTAALKSLCRELGIEENLRQAPPQLPRFVIVDGTLQKAPLSPPAFFTSSLLGFRTKWSVVRDVLGHSAPPDGDESVADFIRRKFSAELLERLVAPFVSGIYAGDPEKLSLRSAFPLVFEAEKTAGSVVRGMMRTSNATRAPRERPTLMSFQGGNETLIEALSNSLSAVLRTRTEVAAVHRIGDGTFELSVRSDGHEGIVRTKQLVFATPTDVAGNLLAALDEKLAEALQAIEYAPVAVISLGYCATQVKRSLDGFGFLIPRAAGLRTLGTVWNSSLFEGRAPERKVLLTSFAGGMTDPAAAAMPEAELVAMVHREIAPLLQIHGDPVFSNVEIYRRAIPQYNLGHQAWLEELERRRRAIPGLWLAGNYLRGPALGACLEHALAVAEGVRNACGAVDK